MFRAIVETDKTYNKTQKHFYLTQGDSCTIYFTPKQAGQAISPELISKCLFKLSNENNVLEYSKELEYDTDHYVLNISSEDSSTFNIDRHIYEFEVTLLGGEVQTPNRWYFDITEQITE